MLPRSRCDGRHVAAEDPSAPISGRRRPATTLGSVTEVPAPLRRDVRLLSTLLGRVLEEAEGPQLLRDVERLRRATIALRRDPSGTRREEAERIVAELPRLRAAQVARAFTAYFQLVNLAEEHQRVRTLRERGRAAGDTIADAVATIRERDGDAALHALLERLELSPVITAHPTEARRQIGDLDPVAGLGLDHQALDLVLELADVARPVVR